MRRLEAVVSHRASCGQSEVHDGGPALQFVVPVVMEQIRRSDRKARPGRLDYRKSRVIVHQVVGHQDFLVAAPPQIQRRKIIERPRRSHACKQPGILLIPEPVQHLFFSPVLAGWCNNSWRWCLRCLRCRRRCLSGGSSREHHGCQSEQKDHPKIQQFLGSRAQQLLSFPI